MSEEIDRREKLQAIAAVARYRPVFTVSVIALSVLAALLEGIGLSFILPIIEHARGATSDPSGLMAIFVGVYEFLGVPFTLGSIVLGVALVMIVRYTMSFLVAWLRVALQTDYVRYLRSRSFQSALDAEVGFFDERGSDDILNAIITQSSYASNVIQQLVNALQVGLVSIVYLSIALFIAPTLTLFAIVVLGLSTVVSRRIFEPGFDVGDRVAQANEDIQETVQAGTQGIRDAKLFDMGAELYQDFEGAIDRYVSASVTQRRNSAGINNFHQLVAALSVFGVIYLGLEYASLSLGSLGVFLFAMFRLSPRVSNLNDLVYRLEANLAHLVRAQTFIQEIEDLAEPSGDRSAPDEVSHVEFDAVDFSYDGEEVILEDVSFEASRGEFVAFVGESGAGKSTIVSLLARMYRPDAGEIRANGTPIVKFDLQSWRERVAVVRQDPFMFNDTLRYNITIGNRDASQREIEEVAEIARVDEFLDELPEGYGSLLGDDGVRLSGGQRQRVSIARALLKDADLLVLDEATSDLDTNIESEVQRRLESHDQNYITITVAHRLSTVRNADRIYTVVDGRIVDVGRHEELLEQSGKYAELYSSSG